MRSDNLQHPFVQPPTSFFTPPTSSYNFQLPHGRHGHGGHGGHTVMLVMVVVVNLVVMVVMVVRTGRDGKFKLDFTGNL